ncbi:hypothetical protein LEP1GSC047_0267 [Leptospira inadai serovar Lyme str. 10]|uniref:Uncharacterized protein n=1 Tax=Leptospira inadai serovar Lyme str. 10 TaxID=1049790 RepID=V6H9R7_9LEPT|nr:hypothetical protein LEP1GSC047_0267 [Leptospira inadai serovar Lyme str. 10]
MTFSAVGSHYRIWKLKPNGGTMIFTSFGLVELTRKSVDFPPFFFKN